MIAFAPKPSLPVINSPSPAKITAMELLSGVIPCQNLINDKPQPFDVIGNLRARGIITGTVTFLINSRDPIFKQRRAATYDKVTSELLDILIAAGITPEVATDPSGYSVFRMPVENLLALQERATIRKRK